MEEEKITPDKKLNKLLSSCISKSFSESGHNRKRPFSEANADEIDQISIDKVKKRHIDSQDDDAYFERVETYDLMSWFAKPVELSPLVCSRYGWKITETDMLKCVGCKAVLCGQLPKRADSLIYHECCRKLIDNIKQSHLKSCFWPAYPSPECFSSIPFKDKKKLMTLLTTYIENLQRLQDQLPLISYKSFEDKGMTANRLEEIKCTVEKHLDKNDLDNMELSTFCLGVTGWNVIDPKAALLMCHYCRRKVGFWNYKNKNSNNCDIEMLSDDSDSEIECVNSQTDISSVQNGPQFISEANNQENLCQTSSDSSTKVEENPPDSPENGLEKCENSRTEFLTKVHESVMTDSLTKKHAIIENQFDFSQPCTVDSLESSPKHFVDHDNEMSSAANEISVEKTYSFSQPNIVEDSNGTENGEDALSQPVADDNAIPVNEENGEVCNENQELINQKKDPEEDLTICSPNEMDQDKSIPKNDVEESSKNNVRPKQKKMKLIKKDSFDPLEEHRYWCPWINRVPDSKSHSPKKILELVEKKTVYPWELALQILSHSFLDVSFEDSISEHFKHHSPVEGLRQLRNLIKEW